MKQRIGGTLPLIWLLAFVPLLSSHAAAGTPVITGRIVFPDGEVPLMTSITLSGGGLEKVTKADSQGHYEIQDLSPGTYDMFITAGGQRNPLGAFGRRNIGIRSGTSVPVVVDVILVTDPEQIRRLGR